MRFLVLCFLFLASCQQKETSINGAISFQDNGLDEFDSEQFSMTFEKLNLKKPQLSEKSDQLFRLTVIPSLYDLSYSIAIMKGAKIDSIDFRILDESNGLLSINKKKVNDTDSLDYFLSKSMVWELEDSLDMCNGSDGTFYIYECYDLQKSNMVFRWSPKICEVDYSDDFLELIDYHKQLIKTIPSSSIVDLW